MPDLYTRALAAAAHIRSLAPLTPTLGIILGSGLGAFASHVKDATTIPYADIPHFPQSTVEGHAGQLLLGTIAGVPVAAICLYPVTDYPGWDNGRICPVGLWGEANAQGERAVDRPFAEEIRRQQALFARSPAPAAVSQPLVLA